MALCTEGFGARPQAPAAPSALVSSRHFSSLRLPPKFKKDFRLCYGKARSECVYMALVLKCSSEYGRFIYHAICLFFVILMDFISKNGKFLAALHSRAYTTHVQPHLYWIVGIMK